MATGFSNDLIEDYILQNKAAKINANLTSKQLAQAAKAEKAYKQMLADAMMGNSISTSGGGLASTWTTTGTATTAKYWYGTGSNQVSYYPAEEADRPAKKAAPSITATEVLHNLMGLKYRIAEMRRG